MNPPLVPYGTTFPPGKVVSSATKGGGSHRRWLITVVFFMPYDTER